MVKATLIPYESFFHRFYEMERIESTVVYWDVESQAWRSFQLENLLDWSPSAKSLITYRLITKKWQ